MRISYVGLFDSLWNEEGIARGLESAGATVQRISPDIKDVMLSRIDDFKPDVVLGAKFNVDRAWVFLDELKERGIPTASWTFDLIIGHPPREMTFDSYVFFKADLIIMTDGGNKEKYEERDVHPKLLRQGIPDEFCYTAFAEPEIDILFVGTENPTFPYRQETLEFLKRTYGDRFKWIGRANPEECRGHDLNELYGKTKIVIGDSMYSPHYWSNRIYETIGRGGFIIHPMIEGLDQEFTPYKEFIPYHWGDYKGLKMKIDYFLAHDDERRKIQEAGFKRVQEQYKMSDRCKVLYQYLCELVSSKTNTIENS